MFIYLENRLLGVLAFRARISFFDTCCLAAEFAQIVEFRTTYLAAAYNVNMIDHSSVDRKNTLDTDPKADLADRHCFPDAAMLAGDNYALKDLQPLFVAFLNADVNLHGITRLKSWNIAL